MTPRITALLIDPQNDFCDLPPELHLGNAPSLPVPGAHRDMIQLASLVDDLGALLSDITLTLDSHHQYDIAHPAYWLDAAGEAPKPFTEICLRDLRDGLFTPRDPAEAEYAASYLERLERGGRYRLMIWPVHCELGTWGHNVHVSLREAYNRWERQNSRVANKVLKGTNPRTEHYSAVLAEVPDSVDPETQLQTALIERLESADLLLIGGEASSHCVRATTEHLLDNFQDQSEDRLKRVVLLTDCMSPVSGFEAQANDFLVQMEARGVTLLTAQDAAALVRRAV